jgi:hypothetical protein
VNATRATAATTTPAGTIDETLLAKQGPPALRGKASRNSVAEGLTDDFIDHAP